MDKPMTRPPGPPALIDCTLREGQQAAGVYFREEQRSRILELLGRIGVDEIEVAYAARDEDLRHLVRSARRLAPDSRIAVWCRALHDDMEMALASRPDVVSVSVPVSDLHIERRLGKSRPWILDRIDCAGELLAGSCTHASLGLEDATRADRGFVVEAAKRAEAAGFERVRLADTVGIAAPDQFGCLVETVAGNVDIEIAVHCHNDFGMASANAIGALRAGAKWADVSVFGIGERAGIARLEEVAAFLTLVAGCSIYNLQYAKEAAATVAEAAQDTVSRRQPIVGAAIFECESGLHLDGLAKDERTYSPFSAARLGARWTTAIGMKAGRAAVRSNLAALGTDADATIVAEVASRVRRASRRAGRPLTQGEFGDIAAPVLAAARGQGQDGA